MPDILKDFGDRVRRHRLRQGLTQEGLAERCGLHWTYIGGLERGERNPTLETISKLSDGLGVAPRDLFERRAQAREGKSEQQTHALFARLLKGRDPGTVQLAMNVLRDVMSWKHRYGGRR